MQKKNMFALILVFFVGFRALAQGVDTIPPPSPPPPPGVPIDGDVLFLFLLALGYGIYKTYKVSKLSV